MTETPTDKPLSERFAALFTVVREHNITPEDGNDWLENSEDISPFVFNNYDAILSALRLAESHPSAIREAVEGERAHCAKIADDAANDDTIGNEPHWRGYRAAGADVAAAIRARGEGKDQ